MMGVSGILDHPLSRVMTVFVLDRTAGWAKRSVPTLFDRARKVGTATPFAHPTIDDRSKLPEQQQD